jgi:hypothetical protein
MTRRKKTNLTDIGHGSQGDEQSPMTPLQNRNNVMKANSNIHPDFTKTWGGIFSRPRTMGIVKITPALLRITSVELKDRFVS